jgi:hypothetical protein
VSDGVFVDFSELNQIAAALADVPANAGKHVRAAVEVTSVKVKKSWREKLDGSRTLPGLPFAVTYDVITSSTLGRDSVIQSEIGFDKDKNQGPLGNVSEFGTVNNPPRGFGLAALQENLKDYEDGLAQALADAEHAAGIDSSVLKGAAAVIRGSYR